MNTKVPYRIKELDLNNIYYSDIKSNGNKTIVYINYMDNNKLMNFVFQTPTLLSSNKTHCKKDIYHLDVPLVGKDSTKIHQFDQFIKALDKKIIKDAKNHNKWFERFANVKTMNYQKIIRVDNDNVNIIRLKLINNNDFETHVTVKNKRIQFNEITSDCWLKCILEIYAIWINKDGFGLFIRPIVMDFKPCMKQVYDYKMIEDSDENAHEVEEIVIDTVQDNSIFIRSESEITSSVLDMPNENTLSSDIPVGNINVCSATSSTEKISRNFNSKKH